MYYDPMISKLITWGKDRTQALSRLNNAIDEYVIRGVIHNAGFGQSIIKNESFIKGDYSTAFIPTFYKDGFQGEVMTPDDHKFLAIMAFRIKHQNDKWS